MPVSSDAASPHIPTLAQAVSTLAHDSGAFAIDAPAGWGQGRTLYGGMTAALAWSAAVRSLPGLPPLRSVQVAFVGPASGALRLTPVILRQGRSATIVGVDVSSSEGGEARIAARATFTCGAPRDSQVSHDRAPAPVMPPPDACEPLFPSPDAGPDFARNFETRVAGGQRPFGGGAPEFTLWSRIRAAHGADPLTALIALADALPPAAMVVFPTFGVISTMTWSFDLDHVPQEAGAWVLLQSVSETTADGYSRQAMHAWDADGRRLLSGRQTVAIFV